MNLYLDAGFEGKIVIEDQSYTCNNEIFLIKSYNDFNILVENFKGYNFSAQITISENKVFASNNLLKIRHLNFDNWLISVKNLPLNNEKVFEKTLQYDDGEAKVEVLKNYNATTVLFYNYGNLKYTKNIKKVFDSFSFKKIKIKNNPYLYFLASNEKEKFAFLVYKSEIIFADFVDEIAFGKEKIKILTKTHDCIGHGNARVFSTENNELQTDAFGVFIDKKIYVNKYFVPYLFLECVKVNNFKQARKYLSDELNKLLDDHKIKEFFKNVYRIEQFKYTENLNINQIAAYNIDDELSGIYKFDVINNLIVNIDML